MGKGKPEWNLKLPAVVIDPARIDGELIACDHANLDINVVAVLPDVWPLPVPPSQRLSAVDYEVKHLLKELVAFCGRQGIRHLEDGARLIKSELLIVYAKVID